MYAKIINEETKQVQVGTGTNTKFYKSIGMTDMEVEKAYNGSWYVKGYAPEEPQNEKRQRLIKELEQATIAHMNAEVAVKDYSSIEIACGYATSSDPVYAKEGKEANDFRDKCWKYFYEQTKGNLPTLEDYKAGLPSLGWN